eukprot:GHVU01140017.1.p1 GENE.GHVU01140017.1~~GHVU01140017.1.p1  ORF type:complete len:519 (-),score=24.55 GHVU01140017.1:616-2172(-)
MNKNKESPMPLQIPPDQLPDRFINYFSKKVAAIESGIIQEQHDSNIELQPEHPFSGTQLSRFDLVSTEELRSIIMKSPTKSCDMDPLPTWLLKASLDVLTEPLVEIVNTCLSTSEVPAVLKQATITPLLKKPSLDREILKNYRPVSNLTVVSKLIERVVCTRLRKHMEDNDLQEPLQSAYRKCHSTETALLRVYNDCIWAMENKGCAVLILLDLSAAFDTVSHHILLNRLEKRVGVTGSCLNFFRNYLLARTQLVSVKGQNSIPCQLQTGVPQGSVLGPILFCIYTLPLGDIVRRHNVSFHLYADDTQLYLQFLPSDLKRTLEQMENCIADIRQWMTANHLKLNEDKTEFLILGTQKRISQCSKVDAKLSIGGDTIEPTGNARNIGVLFDSTLTLSGHVNNTCRTAFFHLHNISKIRTHLDSDSLKSVVHALVTNKLDMYNSLYTGLPQQQINKLKRVHHAAARLITRQKKFERITPILKELHWLPLEQRINYKVLVLTYKCLNGLAPSYLSQLLLVQ